MKKITDDSWLDFFGWAVLVIMILSVIIVVFSYFYVLDITEPCEIKRETMIRNTDYFDDIDSINYVVMRMPKYWNGNVKEVVSHVHRIKDDIITFDTIEFYDIIKDQGYYCIRYKFPVDKTIECIDTHFNTEGETE